MVLKVTPVGYYPNSEAAPLGVPAPSVQKPTVRNHFDRQPGKAAPPKGAESVRCPERLRQNHGVHAELVAVMFADEPAGSLQ